MQRRAAGRAAPLWRTAAEMEPHLQPAGATTTDTLVEEHLLDSLAVLPALDSSLPENSFLASCRCRQRRGTARPCDRDHAALAGDRPGRAGRQEGGVPEANGRRMPLAAGQGPGSPHRGRRQSPNSCRRQAILVQRARGRGSARTSSVAHSAPWIASPRSARRTCRKTRSCSR